MGNDFAPKPVPVTTGELGSVSAPKGSVFEVNITVQPGQDERTEAYVKGNQLGIDALEAGKVVQVNIAPSVKP